MSTLTVGTIAEKVTDAGVSVDGVTLKDGGAVFTSAVTATDNTVDLGASSTRFKDIYLGGGAFLGGTGSANKLEDYEEGTFSPSAIGSTTAGTITNNSTPVGRYTKIGHLVNVFIQMNFSLSGEAGQLRITNLPFACSTGNESVGTFQCNDMGGSYASNVAHYTAVIQGDNDYLHFRGTKNNSGSHDTLSAQNMTFIRANIWYPTG